MILRDGNTRNEVLAELVSAGKEHWKRRGGPAALFSALALLVHGVMVVSLVISSSVTEQIVSFAPQVFVVGVMLHLTAITIGRAWRYLVKGLLGSIVTVGLVAMFVAPWDQPALAEPGLPSLNVTTYNALYTSPDAPQLLPADVVGLQEVTRQRLETVADEMGAEYMYLSSCECTASGTEVGLVSRYEISGAEYFDDGGSGTFVRAELAVAADKTIVVYVAHLPSPENHTGRDRRDHVLAVIRQRLSAETYDVILMGDLSVTIYAQAFQRIRSDLQLQPADYGLVGPCSWYGYGPLLCLRIDHIFVSSGLRFVDARVADNRGSDHRPVSATLTW